MSLVGNVLGRLLIPTALFLLIGVPLESYVRGIPGLFSASGGALSLIGTHLFMEAAACFYCITVLLEGVVILTRPHLRAREGIPVGPLIVTALVLCVVLAVAYFAVHQQIASNDFSTSNISIVLSILMLATAVHFLIVHYLDYLASEIVIERVKRARIPSGRKNTSSENKQ